MATFVVLYPRPDDVEGFEEHYRNVHLPMVRSYPGATAVRVTRFAATPRGDQAPYHLLAEVEFATDEEMAAALRSEPAAASAKDAKAMAERFNITPTMILGSDFGA